MNKLTNLTLFTFLIIFGLISCSSAKKGDTSESKPETATISDDSLLTKIQYQTFQYFWDGAEPNSGLANERIHMDDIYPSNDKGVVTSGGSGFGVMAILVGIKRGFISREEAVARYNKILDFLETADRFHGAYPHWWYGETGKTKPFSKKDDGGDLVETAFLIQGLLAVRQYFIDGNEEEQSIVRRINKIWDEVEWDWYTKGGEDVLYWHWSPNFGWEKDFDVRGYNECLIMYILAASSRTHSVPASVYHKGWAMDGAIATDKTINGRDLVLNHYENDESLVGPLFWAHYSYLGLNPTGLVDIYGEYQVLNETHALSHYDHCVANPNDYEGYGENCWGLTSSYSMRGYAGHRPDRDLGVISPTAALSSFPYTPKESMQMLRWMYEPAQDSLVGIYGPYDAFSLENDWYLKRYLAIDQGPIPVMIENYRSGFIWELFMSSPEIKAGLDKLGFRYE